MKPLIFWEEPLRVAGPGSMPNAIARLNAQLASGRFSTKDRLTGSLKGARLCVWKATVLGRAGDVVEFDGEIRAGGDGTVIEGSVRYQTATKIQFAGLSAIGVSLLGVGLMQKLSGSSAGPELLGLGLFITAVTAVWIGSSAGMRHAQVQFIEERFREIVTR
ncbi:MAG TPA: hypothetical protein VD839_01125 [Burkholderiales bacterium]|nr:hypothetical protein [Burkholderiales bacterium]